MDEKKLKKIFRRYWPVLILGLFFFLRLPSLFEPFTYGDEGIYLALGQALRAGQVFYRDIHDNKPPMLYLVAALTNEFWLYRMFYFLWSLVTIWVFVKLAQKLFGKNKPAVILATFVFAFLTNLHTFEGNIANAENLMMLPTIGAFYLILKNRSWFWSGALLSLATLFKIPAGFDFAAFLVFGFLVAKKKECLKLFHRAAMAVIGFAGPLFITFVYYANQGALTPYLKAAFFQNIPYLASWAGTQAQGWGLPWPLIIRGLLALLTVVILFIFRKKVSSTVCLVITWFTFSLFAALLSSRPYPHYLVQVLPALSLSWGLVLSRKKEKIVPLILSLILLASSCLFHFWHNHNWPYYQNFYQFAFNQKNKQEYWAWFGDQTQSLYDTAAFLQTHTTPNEQIFIWGTRPSIYALAHRLPVGRYTTSYHIIDFDGYQETIAALQQNPPRYIIVTGEENRPFPTFFAFLENHYTPTILFNQIRLFRLVQPQP